MVVVSMVSCTEQTVAADCLCLSHCSTGSQPARLSGCTAHRLSRQTLVFFTFLFEMKAVSSEISSFLLNDLIVFLCQVPGDKYCWVSRECPGSLGTHTRSSSPRLVPVWSGARPNISHQLSSSDTIPASPSQSQPSIIDHSWNDTTGHSQAM